MKTYLVTGAAGFIGANYLKYILAKHDDIRVVVLDALTYAGNLGTIASDIDNERCFFVKGDICDRDLADQLFSEYKFDYIVNFAAESHVDRSIENPQLFLQTNILGTQNLLDAARRAWVTGKDENGYPTWRKDVRYHQVSTDEVYGSLGAEGFFTETTPLCPHTVPVHGHEFPDDVSSECNPSADPVATKQTESVRYQLHPDGAMPVPLLLQPVPNRHRPFPASLRHDSRKDRKSVV